MGKIAGFVTSIIAIIIMWLIIDKKTDNVIIEIPEEPLKTIYAWNINKDDKSFWGIETLNKCDFFKNMTLCINSFEKKNEDDKNINISSDSGNIVIDYDKIEPLNMLNDTLPLKNDSQLLSNETVDKNDTTESILTDNTTRSSSEDILNITSDVIETVKSDSNTLYDFYEVDISRSKVFETAEPDVNPKCNYEQIENYILPDQVLNNLILKNKIGSFDCAKCSKGVKKMKVLFIEERKEIHYKSCESPNKYIYRNCVKNRKWVEDIKEGCVAECSCPMEK